MVFMLKKRCRDSKPPIVLPPPGFSGQINRSELSAKKKLYSSIMMTETLKTKTASLRLFALAVLMTAVSTVTAQTLLEENFSSGFEEWTAVNPPGGSMAPPVGRLAPGRDPV